MLKKLTGTVVLLLLCASLQAQDGISLEVWVEQAKSDELPWDGCPHSFASGGKLLGDLMGNPFHPTPPEIQLLVLRMGGEAEMHPNRTCNDQLSCRFKNIALGEEVVGVLLFDADVGVSDLIDAAVIVPAKSKQWLGAAEQMQATMKATIARLTPETPNLCKIQVAPKQVKIYPLAQDECPQGIGCSLSQSSWSYERGPLQQQADDWEW